MKDVPAIAEYGVWGGGAPGGWCAFPCDNSHRTYPESQLGYGYATADRAEADRGRDMFSGLNPSLHYEVATFDPEREPEGSDGVPTEAQARWFGHLVTKGETRELWALPGSRKIYGALMDRGWVMTRVRPERAIVATMAGWEALRRRDRQ